MLRGRTGAADGGRTDVGMGGTRRWTEGDGERGLGTAVEADTWRVGLAAYMVTCASLSVRAA